MTKFTGTVGVTGLNATDNPGPGVAVARALRHHPDFAGRIVGLAYDALDPGLYVPGLFDDSLLVPYPSAGRDALFARLAHAKERFGMDVLIPTLDSELPALLDQEEALADLGIGTYLPTRAQYDLRSKAKLAGLADQGVPVPEAVVLTDPAELYALPERFGFPLVVKGVFYGAEVAWTLDDAVKAFHKQAAEWGYPIIVQRYVAGEEYCVAALGDGEGGLLGAVPMKKLMLTKQGKGWAGVTIADPGLQAVVEKTMRALKWRGPCELEINPRFPAWIDLTAGADQNLPFAAARLAAGEHLDPLPPYRVGAAFVRASINQLVDISDLEAVSTSGESWPAPDPGAPTMAAGLPAEPAPRPRGLPFGPQGVPADWEEIR